MTAVAKASTKVPAAHSSARPHRFARMRWPVCSRGSSCMVCLPRGFGTLPAQIVEARGAPLLGAGSHDLRVLWDVQGLVPVDVGLRQVPGEEGGDVLCVHAVEVKMEPAGHFTSRFDR